MFRSGHPLDKDSLSIDEFCGADHVVVVSAGTGHAVFWHAKFNKDPASKWLRGLIFDTFADGR